MCINLPRKTQQFNNLCQISKINIELMQNTKYIYGNIANFGPEKRGGLLTPEDHRDLFRLLRCTKCRLRFHYHRLVLYDMKSSEISSRILIFHSLSRLCKAFLNGMKAVQKSTSFDNFSSINLQINCQDFTLFKFPLHVGVEKKKPKECCPVHGREILELLFYSKQTPSRKLNLFYPGFSRFYSDDDEDNSEDDSKIKSPRVIQNHLIYPNSFIKFSVNIQYPAGIVIKNNFHLASVNEKWNSVYRLNISEPKVSRVHFFKNIHSDKPVTKIHQLRTYETAANILRSDRTWELESAARFHETMKSRISNENAKIFFPLEQSQNQKKSKKRRRRSKKSISPQIVRPISCES